MYGDNKFYIVHEMLGNFSFEAFKTDEWNEAQEYLEEREQEARREAEENGEEFDEELFYSYFSIDEVETKFVVTGYLRPEYYGVMEYLETDDWSTVTEKAHEWLMQGNYVEIDICKTGERFRLDPDEYAEQFEIGNGEFPIQCDLYWIR